MLNRYPLWKYLLILLVVVFGFVYASANLYAPDPAVQISGQSSGMDIDERVLRRVERALEQAGIDYFGAEADGSRAQIRLNTADSQMRAQRYIQEELGDDFIVALNLAATTPRWLERLGASPMRLGLDLAGGVHFLMEVDTAAAIHRRQEINSDAMRARLRDERIRYSSVSVGDDNVVIGRFRNADLRDQALRELRREYQNLEFSTEDPQSEGASYRLNAVLSDTAVREIEDYALSQNLVTLRNRVNELGVSEPVVQRQGRSRIIVQLPGVQDTAEAKRIIGKTANLEFRLEALPDSLVSMRDEFEFRSESDAGRTAELERQVILTGDHVANASSGFDHETSQPQVNITLDSAGGAMMHRATRGNIGRRMGVLFIEYRTTFETRENEFGEEVQVPVQEADRRIISLATVQAALGVQFRITGLDSPAEASELALLLRAGALAAPMYFVEERTIGPSLGAENIQMGVTSVKWGLALVLLFMLLYYRAFGVIANIALTVNLVLLIAVMSLLGATLTLPGIAGIVLTVGMAVDANVLIFSRIREELKAGSPPQSAIAAGYDRAFVTIMDANITTLIVAIILYAIGTGPVQGFAVTLSIGILTSMFTALLVTRSMVNLAYGGRRNLQKIWI
ncbi:protein translocase subunit SecD [Marinimicrobium alkaliphilum]|uniref:protein translocase subunit SecD n=1 Tax=Marinimicrobium alkaliphilum TaxID=2202654 RepID=UPI000DB91FE9|nr:protein translocase subunit SecD [Marinimicrobium alkaliphilum]